MYSKQAKDLMIPVDDYPTINEDASMLDAMSVLKKTQENRKEEHQPYRAVLVLNAKKEIVGKIGHLSFLKAFEPKYDNVFDMEKLTRASLSGGFIESLMDKFALWDDTSVDLCKIAHELKAKDIMQPVSEHIDENESVFRAIHKLVMWQSLSVLVSRGREIVGILRLSDIYNELENYVIACANNKKGTTNGK